MQGVPQHCQALTDGAFFLPDTRNVPLSLPVGSLAVHSVDCLAGLDRRIAVFPIVDLANGFSQMRAYSDCGTDV